MRTKTLLITAALGAAGLMTASAQVYSVNAVGYVNVSLPIGGAYALISNPLNGTNNALSTIMPLGENGDGTVVYAFNVTTQNFEGANFFGGVGWFPDMVLAPGEGFFVQAQNTDGVPLPVTFVGEVPQGTLANALAPTPNYSLKASMVPQSARLGDQATAGTLLFPAEDGDAVLVWNVVTQQYDSYNYFGGYGWAGADPDVAGPIINVANGFFVLKGPGTTLNNWTRTFSVNP